MKRILVVVMASGLLAFFSTLQADTTDPECEAGNVANSGAIGARSPCKNEGVANDSSEMDGEGNTLNSDAAKQDKKNKKKKKEKDKKEKKNKGSQKENDKQDEIDRKD